MYKKSGPRQYINEHFSIPDRRGEAGYESWQENADNIRARIADYELTQVTDLQNWTSEVIEDDRFTAVMNFSRGAVSDDALAQVVDLLRERGLKLSEQEASSGFVVILQGGHIVATSASPTFLWHDSLFSGELMVKGCGDSTVIQLGYAKYAANENGLTVFLYDDLTGELVEVVAWMYGAPGTKELIAAM